MGLSETAAIVAAPGVELFHAVRQLALDAVASPITRAMYSKALDDFFAWREEQGRPPFTRASVHAHRAQLQARGYSASTINQRLAAIRKLAQEAAANGILDAESAAAIDQVPGIRQQGTRAGNWLTKAQAESLINLPDARTVRGKRDRAILALLIGCGLRRAEATSITIADLTMRENRWVLVDLRGKHGRIRTVPVPGWVKQAIDAWLESAGITTGPLLRSINRHGQIAGSLSPQAILALVGGYGHQMGLTIKPHDLRRTCAKLCRAAGGELEQIQLLLGHASIQTTERYLGVKQDLIHAPNDAISMMLT
jgi:site-specific recombinase XerD